MLARLATKYAVPADRLRACGSGLYGQVASNDSEDGRAKNRRVELAKQQPRGGRGRTGDFRTLRRRGSTK